MDQFIAVYGTLRKGEGNHHFLSGSQFVLKTQIGGFKMYGKNRFPTVISGEEEEKITIEVYRIREEKVLSAIDLLEGFIRSDPQSAANFYTIKEIFVEGIDAPVEIYTFDHQAEMVHEIGPRLYSGDWCKRS